MTERELEISKIEDMLLLNIRSASASVIRFAAEHLVANGIRSASGFEIKDEAHKDSRTYDVWIAPKVYKEDTDG